MTVDQMRAAREANPFVPFTIHTANGRTHRIPHRDYVSISPTGRTVVVYQNNDACGILDLLLITEVEVDAPIPQPTSAVEAA